MIFHKIICIAFSDWINIAEAAFLPKRDIEYKAKCNSFTVLVDYAHTAPLPVDCRACWWRGPLGARRTWPPASSSTSSVPVLSPSGYRPLSGESCMIKRVFMIDRASPIFCFCFFVAFWHFCGGFFVAFLLRSLSSCYSTFTCICKYIYHRMYKNQRPCVKNTNLSKWSI